MDLLAQIKAYRPFDDIEAADKESFLKFLEVFPGREAYLRENVIGHLTPSCWIANFERTKVLMNYHLLRNVWAWLGGHADGDTDLPGVALKEAREESGLSSVRLVSNEIFDLSVLDAIPHLKKGKRVSFHLHYSPAYLLEADEVEPLQVCEGENSALEWVPLDEVLGKIAADNHIDHVLYGRLNEKMKRLGTAV